MRKLAWAVTVVGGILLAALGLCGIVQVAVGNRPMPPRGDPSGTETRYRVGVLGDAQKGVANLRDLVRAVQAEDVAFLLQTGDLVSDNDEGHYRLTALYLERGGVDRPWVGTPGNHDVKGGPERFVREVGALERSFVRGKVAYLIVDNASGLPPDPVRLEARVAAVPDGLAVVVSMHVPPFRKDGTTLPEYGPFLTWLEKSRVRYVFSGQVHNYVRKTVGSTVLIANGVGGDYDSWQLKQKVYATILQVDGLELRDRTIVREPRHEIWENVEKLALSQVAEVYRAIPVLCWAGTVVLTLGVVASTTALVTLQVPRVKHVTT